MHNSIPIKRALISVSDKTGIVELATYLLENGCEIISTGGSQKVLEAAGLTVTDIQTVTGNPEAFGGRMKTISFQIESALLYDRKKDQAEAEELNIKSIDLVICNLYPFKKVLKADGSFDQLIENIDIGGPTMIRAAAKNFKYVSVLTDPSDYADCIEHLKENEGSTKDKRQYWMTKAFNHTADYDALIAQTMDQYSDRLSYRLSFKNGIPLRYGENNHQSAKFYKSNAVEYSLADLEFLHGKVLSFNNILDVDAAVNCLWQSNAASCAVIKHSNPCGFASSNSLDRALALAWAGDPISAFGSIIAFNQKVDLKTVEFFQLKHSDRSKRKFIEVIIAPNYDSDALVYLQSHKNLRILKIDLEKLIHQKDIRYLSGSLLVQDANNSLYKKLESVSNRDFNVDQNKDLVEFGLHIIRQIKSNGIAIIRRHGSGIQLLGMGAGQPNRLIATQLAIQKSRENLRNEFKGDSNDFEQFLMHQFAEVILVSDAFFPFPDNIEIAGQAGIKHIVQPGGSIKDKEVINACNAQNIAMLFTGLRHFKH
ncbi:UNVERIFIED_CONTAM: hypothetical protein GTU68_057218 [Idotea baltica]|nr:hypothetical protein [Idotea baltica]